MIYDIALSRVAEREANDLQSYREWRRRNGSHRLRSMLRATQRPPTAEEYVGIEYGGLPV